MVMSRPSASTGRPCASRYTAIGLGAAGRAALAPSLSSSALAAAAGAADGGGRAAAPAGGRTAAIAAAPPDAIVADSLACSSASLAAAAARAAATASLSEPVAPLPPPAGGRAGAAVAAGAGAAAGAGGRPGPAPAAVPESPASNNRFFSSSLRFASSTMLAICCSEHVETFGAVKWCQCAFEAKWAEGVRVPAQQRARRLVAVPPRPPRPRALRVRRGVTASALAGRRPRRAACRRPPWLTGRRCAKHGTAVPVCVLLLALLLDVGVLSRPAPSYRYV